MFNNQESSFQQESAPSHKAWSTQSWFVTNVSDFIRAEDWPSSSSDLNRWIIIYGDCNGGSTCITLDACPQFRDALQDRRDDRYLLSLLSTFHCGYDDVDLKLSKVCCPKQVKSEDKLPIQLPDETVCGIQNADRIVGGAKVDLDEYPWMALLNYQKPNGNGFHCGGALISSKYVLTAAHCVKGRDIPKSWKLKQVRLGEWNITSEKDCNKVECAPPVIDIDIEEEIPHSEFDPYSVNQHNDIALLLLKKEVVFNDFIKPICLPSTDVLRSSTFEGLSMDVAGWGQTETQRSSDVKLKVSVPVVEASICQQKYSRVRREISASQLCAGGCKGNDSCRGDSGGPLMGQMPKLQNWMIVGVVSYGPTPCGSVGWPGVYTRVTSYVDWILANMKP